MSPTPEAMQQGAKVCAVLDDAAILRLVQLERIDEATSEATP